MENKFKYYLVEKRGYLVAYNKESDFFVMFNKKKNEWVPGCCSFQSFENEHLMDLEEIGESKALSMTNGKLPNIMLEEFNNLLSND